MQKTTILLLLFLFFFSINIDTTKAQSLKEEHLKALEWRCIGPFRGGRSAAVTGVKGKPNLYYMGATGGGVWQTTDAGNTWTNISDGFFGGSIGAVAVSEYDNNVIYVGGGEVTVRGNVSHGYGMWKSVDAGKTWENIGLNDSRHITRVAIHPKNPDIVYVSALGHLYGANEERGVYKSVDGGKTWKQILFVNENAGAVDLTLDPNNSRILYASTWRVKRTPYSLESGGEGSALWKSTDAGKTWKNLTEKAEGLPTTPLGIMGVTVSPVNSNRVWAIIEAKEGGVFRSDDAGQTWKKINSERKLRQRAWYYTRIYADTQDEDMVYVVNVHFHQSKDGGKTFQSIATPHGDHHDLWISPDDHNFMIVGDDGGAQVTLNGGENWSTYHNQPTAQFYRVTTDNHFPYRIYGGQQDNTTVRILSRSYDTGISTKHWEATAGGESGHIASNPENPDIVFGGSYGGYLTKKNHDTGETNLVDIYPDNPMGWGAKDLKYRFQWNFPLLFSKHEKNTLYAAANVLFRSKDEGHSWEKISPDLTRNDTTKMASSGGLITQDNTSVEYYGTIFAVAESQKEQGAIWVGSDDGLVHITRDNGKSWQNITPKNMPEWMMINCIEADPFEAGTAYLAGTKYKLDDFKPYLYKTSNYGKSWTKITNGIPETHFTRAIRKDLNNSKILYAGTESGIYVSFDDGQNWQSLQLNLPIVPITDLAVKDNDLIVATQGRSFWILDNLELLTQIKNDFKGDKNYLFKSENTYNRLGGNPKKFDKIGKNPANGVLVNFYLKEEVDSATVVKLEFLDKNDRVLRTFTNEKSKDKKKKVIKAKQGMNKFVWDMRLNKAKDFKGMILWIGLPSGPKVVPDTYKVRLTVGEETFTQNFEIKKDPNISASQADLQAQFDFLLDIRDKLTEIHESIIHIRKTRATIKEVQAKIKDKEDTKDLQELAKEILTKLKNIEETLYQTKSKSPQDPLNFPIRLNNKLSSLVYSASYGYAKPTQSMLAVQKDLYKKIDAELAKFEKVKNTDIPKFNQLYQEKNIPVIRIGE